MGGPGEQVELPDGSWTSQPLYVRALELDAALAAAYCNLGAALVGPGASTRMPDGSTWTQQALFTKAIELEPFLAPAYRNLAVSIRSGEKAGLGSTEWTRQELFTKALELDPADAQAYDGLAL